MHAVHSVAVLVAASSTEQPRIAREWSDAKLNERVVACRTRLGPYLILSRTSTWPPPAVPEHLERASQLCLADPAAALFTTCVRPFPTMGLRLVRLKLLLDWGSRYMIMITKNRPCAEIFEYNRKQFQTISGNRQHELEMTTADNLRHRGLAARKIPVVFGL